MMPNHLRIKKVEIYYSGFLTGFKFFAKNKELIWTIGNTDSRLFVDTVVLSDNEVIIGVAAKVQPDYQSCYTDFQFQIGGRE
jgi:hypothetical protein